MGSLETDTSTFNAAGIWLVLTTILLIIIKNIIGTKWTNITIFERGPHRLSATRGETRCRYDVHGGTYATHRAAKR